MPQIDKVTFLTTVYWVFAFYFILYLDLNVNYLYKFVTRLKLNLQRLIWIGLQSQKNNYLVLMLCKNYSFEKQLISNLKL